MCFSAEASFGTGVILATIGSVAVAQSKNKSQLFFACIPLLFSIQQIAEGILWLALQHPEYYSWKMPFTYIFLTFAVVIWPVWVPLSVFWLEKNNGRKKTISITLIAGILFSLILVYCLVNYPAYSSIKNYHISYTIGAPYYSPVLSKLLYFTATTFSLLLSGHKKIKWLGLIILGSYITSEMFFPANVISVWCFFAALASIMILIAIREMNKKTD